MRICFVTGTLGRGGAERQLIYMLRALVAEQIQARVVCLTKGEAFEKEIRDLGVDVDHIGRSRGKLSRLASLIFNLRERPADILQSSHFYTNIYAAAAGRALNVPSIGAIRNDLSSEIKSNGAWGRWQLSLPRSQIANTNLAVERAIAVGYAPNRIFLVRNAVEATQNDFESGHGRKFRLLFAGRLVEQKRPELFIELARSLLRSLPDFDLEFIIAGDGPLRPRLEGLADRYQLRSDIRFLGERAIMADVYTQADVLVSTSAHEGTPNVILEAMAHGLPVVATRVGGVPEIVQDGCGILVDTGDLDGLVNAASTLILDDRLREGMGRRARIHVMNEHSIDHLRKRLRDVYSSVLTRDWSEHGRSTRSQTAPF